MKRVIAAVVAAFATVVVVAATPALASTPKTFGDGTYVVGRSVPAGTYRAAHAGAYCYWARLSGFSGSLKQIIANNFGGGPQVVTISSHDRGFQTNGCGSWTSNLSRITKSMTSFGAGTYIVRTDISPGTFSAPGGSGCYWARLSGFGGTLNQIIANDMGSRHVIVKIAATDKGFQSQGCGTFRRI